MRVSSTLFSILIAVVFGSFTIGAAVAFGMSQESMMRVTIIEQEELPAEAVQNTLSLRSFSGGQLYADQDDTGSRLIPLRGVINRATGIISDPSGELNLDRLQMTVYRSGVSGGFDCTTDSNNCYRVDKCLVELTNYALQRSYECAVQMMPWADATDNTGPYPHQYWVIAISAPHRETGEQVVMLTSEKEVQSVLDIQLSDSIDFDVLKRGETTTAENNTSIQLTQDGNTATEFMVYGEDFTCSGSGTIPVERLQWSLKDVGYDEEGSYPLSRYTEDTGLEIGYNTIGIEDGVSTSLYINMAVPEVGVAGRCSGDIHVLSKAME